MPPTRRSRPSSLEKQCTQVFLHYLFDEIHLLTHMRQFEQRSVILRHIGFDSERFIHMLDSQLSTQLRGILQDMIRQKMANLIIQSLHNVISDVHDAELIRKLNVRDTEESRTIIYPEVRESTFQLTRPTMTIQFPHNQYRFLPLIRLFETVLNNSIKVLDFSKNKQWKETEKLPEIARMLWKIVGEKCKSLEKLIVPKELIYSSTLNSVIRNSGECLTHLTLKRNIPNDMFLSIVGTHCPNLQELDIAGADVVTDFGVVCLLFQDPEQIFMECWNREKTVGSVRRSQRAFPHPHFDKPIPDPTEVPAALNSSRNLSGFLHLKKNFHDVIKDPSYEWEALPICQSFRKIRLENTKVKGDGASVIIEKCKNLYSLGYLVFAAAGLKQVFGYEKDYETSISEIFYRGPSDQKLVTIAKCCPKLSKLFLGSNSVRPMTVSLFQNWPLLSHLTLENIVVENVTSCLRMIGRQLKGLKLQCAGFELQEVAWHCPNLVTFVIQREVPAANVTGDKTGQRFFPHLKHIEITCSSFPKVCFNFVMTNATELKSVKVYGVPNLQAEDFELWGKSQTKLETFILFRGEMVNYALVESILEAFPNLRALGDLRTFNLRRPLETKKLNTRASEEKWDLKIIESEGAPEEVDDKDFLKLLTLHWFYLSEASDK